MKTASYPDGRSYTYAYDAVGNRTSSNENGTQNTYTYNSDNQLSAKGARTFTYDNQGNEISDGSKALTYDFYNRLKSLNGTALSFIYDGLGNRLSKTSGGTTHHFTNSTVDGLSKVLVDKNTTANTQNYLVYGDSLLSQGDATTTGRQYYITDSQGNVRYLTNSTGQTVQTYAYDPFGTETAASVVSNYTFQSQEKDAESGLTYLRARYYDPTTGRFISRDPVPGTLNVPDSQNGYSYANSDPVNLSDPSGQFVWLVVGGALALWAAYDAISDFTNCNYPSLALDAVAFLPVGRVTKVGTKAAPLMDRALAYLLGNKATQIGGRTYVGHALDEMQNAGIYPSVVENTIKHGIKVPSSAPDTTRLYDSVNDITVVINQKGDVVTTFYGR